MLKYKLQFHKSLSYLLLPVMVFFTFNYTCRAIVRIPPQSETMTLSFNIKYNAFAYSGYYQDTESGMYYLNARYYSPELMRFINRDTYDLSNRYAYCNGNPISQTDPNGHMPGWLNYLLCGVAIVGGIWSGGASLAAATAWGIGFGVTGGTLGVISGSTQFAASKTDGTVSSILNKISFATGIAGTIADIGGGIAAYKAARFSQAEKSNDVSDFEKNLQEVQEKSVGYYNTKESYDEFNLDIWRTFNEKNQTLLEKGVLLNFEDYLKLPISQRAIINQTLPCATVGAVQTLYKIRLLDNGIDILNNDKILYSNDFKQVSAIVDDLIESVLSVDDNGHLNFSVKYIEGEGNDKKRVIAKEFCTELNDSIERTMINSLLIS